MTPNTPRWQLQPPAAATRAFLFVLVLLLPLGIVAGIALQLLQADTAGLPPVGGSRQATAWMIVSGVAVAGLVAGWLLGRAFRRHCISLDEGTIDITTTFYRRTLALSALRLEQARVVDLDERTELKPMLKTNGTSLPGLRSGWFRLRNREKALVATAGGKRVLWLPTDAGYGLLLQPHSPQALLDELRALAERPARR